MTTRRRTLFALVSTLAAFSACGQAGGDRATTSDEVNASPYWRHTISFPEDPFVVVGGREETRWVKFTIFVNDPTKVYFQDSQKYPFHYDFARNHLPEYASATTAEFAKAALKAEGQKLVTGTVLLPPAIETSEYGIQLAREDAYTKEEVKKYVELVKANVQPKSSGSVGPGYGNPGFGVPTLDRPVTVFYMPTFEQAAATERDRTWLEENGVLVGSPERWLDGDACYSKGWSFGTAKFVPGAEIKKAYLDGRLTPADILVTDGVPAEVPFVAGIVSLAASTPNSHVALLSQTWNIPFVYPISQSVRVRVQGLAEAGKEVVLRTVSRGDRCSLDVIEPEGTVDAATRAHLAELRIPEIGEIPVREHLGVLTKKSVDLRPSDMKYFGGKATNFGSLRRSIPNESPNALGVSFDLWEAFLAQTMPSGKTLAQEIDDRLGSLAFPPDVRVLEPRLQEIRDLVKKTAKMPEAEQAKLFAALQDFGFDPKTKLRFRSSTNVEDGDVLSGAGLYDSYSGCLADDLDADDVGPSACNPKEPEEQGVVRAIKKVYASFFNTNAVIERLKYRIPERHVGMALAVHPSFPDEIEAANGVATVHLSPGLTTIDLVTQLGAESVTNPDGSAVPETINVEIVDNEPSFVIERGSSRVPAGKQVMTWQMDYRKLVQLLTKASTAFVAEHGAPDDAIVDLEYKKQTDGAMVVKQVRFVPQRSQTPSVVPVLFNEPVSFCTKQGEYGDVLGIHRTKAAFRLTTRNTVLSDAGVAQSLLGPSDLAFVDGNALFRTNATPSTLPGAAHVVDGDLVHDAWNGSGITFGLQAYVARLVAPAEIPVVVPRDFGWTFSVTYPSPRPRFDPQGMQTISEVNEDTVSLVPCIEKEVLDGNIQRKAIDGPKGISVKTEYQYRFHPKQTGGITGGVTYELGAWGTTEIRGLTSTPIVLRGSFSQSFRPQHHNFAEDFAFEPGLEEGLPESVRKELEEKDIQILLMGNADSSQADFYVVRRSSQKLEKL